MKITFQVPLPPPALRANGRSNFWSKSSAANLYALECDVWITSAQVDRAGMPWPAAQVHYEWRYATAAPDQGNLGGHVKYLQDILAMAPRSAPRHYKRWHFGLVDDDRYITATYTATKVPRRRDECVIVTATRKARL